MRLIDADALMMIVDAEIERAEEEMRDAEERPNLYTDDFRKHKSYTAAGMAHIAQDILEAPTIDAVPRWIPVEERFPEIGEGFCSKDVIVALDDGGIAFTCLEATLFGSVCWQIERMNEIEGCKEINVIAWMPLPDPYVGERKDDE